MLGDRDRSLGVLMAFDDLWGKPLTIYEVSAQREISLIETQEGLDTLRREGYVELCGTRNTSNPQGKPTEEIVYKLSGEGRKHVNTLRRMAELPAKADN